ncbi:hypothetical protein M378DRAFT_166477 [Amanita muscaria Koide BX008]|uniref:Uncharacterized protein n=1 Tax=Amanita muscaria (strain Koide BX008) TaxID=946122 RepID=A0A0C2WJU0_AMAMK|nr:hypothetical protein M378DRAFT_166477 [Amanita muscaria Koide BX008]
MASPESIQPPLEPVRPKEFKEPSQPKESKESKNKFEESSEKLPPTHSPHQFSLRQVAPPLSDIPLHRFIYLLLITLSLIALFYTFRLAQYKTDVGGWWNLFLGKTPAPAHFGTGKGFPKLKDDGKVETRLHLLAESLGIPPSASDELVGAIASVVREFVPPASLSSIAAKETGRAVRILVEYVPARTGGGPGSGSKASPAGVASSEGVANVVDGVVNAFVGVDDHVL